MLKRNLLFYFKSYPKTPIFPIKNFSTEQKPSTPEKEAPKKNEQKSAPKIQITPKMIGIGLVCLSWVFILKVWKDFEGETVQRAHEYYEKGIKMDVAPPEEYRKEYVNS